MGRLISLSTAISSDTRTLTTARLSSTLTFKEALLQMQQKDSTLLAELTNILTGSKHSAYFFETPSITKATLANKKFEFVLVEAQQLVGIKSDTDTFADYFTNCDQKSVTSFMNLGGDALLVAPCPMGPETDL